MILLVFAMTIWYVNAVPISLDIEPVVDNNLTMKNYDGVMESIEDQFDHTVRRKRGCIPGYTAPGGCAPVQQNEYLSPSYEYAHDINIQKSYPDDLASFLYGS